MAIPFKTNYFLSPSHILRLLEEPSLYDVVDDELYELDERAFEFLKACYYEDCPETDDMEFLEYCLNEGILTTQKTQPIKHTIRGAPEPSLRYLELLITDRCNLRCRHCYVGEPGAKELPFEQIVNVLEEFEEMQGLRVLISGGEPLLHREFVKINDFLKEYPLRKVLLTNGLLLSTERLKNLNVEEIQISLDGMNRGHESLRGRGTFERTLEAMKMVKEHGFSLSVSTMVHPENLDEFDEMERLLEEIGVSEWTVDVPCQWGRMKENHSLYLPPEVAGRYLNYGFGGGFHGGKEGYGCGVHLCSVLPDGRVAKCAFYADKAVGHVSEGLEECWKRIRPIGLEDLKCRGCAYINDCRGGCRFRAELLEGPGGKDIYKCHAFER